MVKRQKYPLTPAILAQLDKIQIGMADIPGSMLTGGDIMLPIFTRSRLLMPIMLILCVREKPEFVCTCKLRELGIMYDQSIALSFLSLSKQKVNFINTWR